jgi:hypothetical protein
MPGRRPSQTKESHCALAIKKIYSGTNKKYGRITLMQYFKKSRARDKNYQYIVPIRGGFTMTHENKLHCLHFSPLPENLTTAKSNRRYLLLERISRNTKIEKRNRFENRFDFQQQQNRNNNDQRPQQQRERSSAASPLSSSPSAHNVLHPYNIYLPLSV